MSHFGLPQLPCCAGSSETLAVLGEFPNRLPELIHLQLLPQVTTHLGQLQLLRRTGLLDTFVLLAVLCSLNFLKVSEAPPGIVAAPIPSGEVILAPYPR